MQFADGSRDVMPNARLRLLINSNGGKRAMKRPLPINFGRANHWPCARSPDFFPALAKATLSLFGKILRRSRLSPVRIIETKLRLHCERTTSRLQTMRWSIWFETWMENQTQMILFSRLKLRSENANLIRPKNSPEKFLPTKRRRRVINCAQISRLAKRI